MGDAEDRYHQLRMSSDVLEPFRSSQRLMVGIALLGASSLVCIFAVMASCSGAISAVDLATNLYFKEALLSQRGPLHSWPQHLQHRLPTLQFRPGSFGSQPSPLQYQPGPLKVKPGTIRPQSLSMASMEKEQNTYGRVVVVGAGGKTGRLVLEQLLQTRQPGNVIGLVRSEEKADVLAKTMSESLIMPALEAGGDPATLEKYRESVAVADVLDETSLASQFSGASTVIVCSSATPQLKKRSILPTLLKRVVSLGKKGMPSFRFPPNGTPEDVDYVGVKNIIQAAKSTGVKRVVLIGSMGGTQKENRLNYFGEGKNGGQGNILVWKRKAEMQLLSSGLEYTIIHPGGLLDEEGGKRELIVSCDDEILKTNEKYVPRADVAAMAVQCIDCPEAKNRAFDMASLPEDQGVGPTKDLCALVGSLGSRSCDYSINVPP